ncbi:uncharacterized protein LOC115450378 [Manduca sexta]|uniref:Osiris 9 n=1 Tax=Manduca sexta TaxID=7130 RepID=A0A921ZMC4_MANSE|nr:uncharacterized protein LOC115450378 [Manduca sexta]KAG6460662.1 hypothetical protein O3G_MSEX012141 [Manduca sexta]
MKFTVIVLSVFAVVQCTPLVQEDPMMRSLMDPLLKCSNSDTYSCLKEQALTAVQKVRTLRKLKIFDGITLFNNNPKEARSLDSLPTDPALRSKQVTEKLWETAADIFQNGELELSYGGEEEESRAMDDVDEARGKKKKAIKKKLKLLIPLLILAKAKAVALVVIALIVIAASLFKIALLAKIAFIIKIIALIKALLAKKHATEETWEVAPHGWEPHVEHSHVEHGHGWEGGWSRSRNEANNMAYSAYNN